ncbi:carbohydrate kinase [Spirosoma taeanense]|uniref:Carbohydrate kinase n=1 Tax=Spirosoma taeanense TaxID=2735870 RepID=A0A6M5Y9X4_9BACT|nr:PfkB family carbohydrate kinase [Spirosoma taeanense]QJW90031.1 carbohydrate kinase [Spirosoma taeanense]
MTASEITAHFSRILPLKVGVVGDFALDLYLTVQPDTGERSLETGRAVFWGSQPRSSLGAAGNVVQNLVALGVRDVRVVGCVGNDLFGREMRHLFTDLLVDTRHLYTVHQDWDTCVYTKPMQAGTEANRIDFGTQNQLNNSLFNQLLFDLEQTLPDLDVLILNQQFANPLLDETRVTRLNALIARFPNVRFVADMRQVGQLIRGTTLKVNTAEMARFLNLDLPDQPDCGWCAHQARTLSRQCRGPVVVTRGEAGMLYVDQTEIQSVPGLPLRGELDTVGAGDTVVAALAACLGAGMAPAPALEIANLAAAVTVQKLQQTGTASLTEILAVHAMYNHHD